MLEVAGLLALMYSVVMTRKELEAAAERIRREVPEAIVEWGSYDTTLRAGIPPLGKGVLVYQAPRPENGYLEVKSDVGEVITYFKGQLANLPRTG
jgi:hypothetical protein